MGELTLDQTSVFTFRMTTLEQQVTELRQCFDLYVSAKENELQLRVLQDTVTRIETNTQELRVQLNDVKKTLATQGHDAQLHTADQCATIASLQIWVLWGTVSVIFTVLSGIFIGYVVHFFTKQRGATCSPTV